MDARFLKVTQSVVMISAAAALLSPFASHAESAATNAAMDVCISRFIAGNFPDRQTTIKVKKESVTESPLLSLASRPNHTIYLSAKGRSTGTKLASATCVVNDRGVILSMRSRSGDKAAGEKVANL